MRYVIKDSTGGDVNVITNRQHRFLMSFGELTEQERETFDYVTDEARYDNRFFRYLGIIFDVNEFVVAPDYLKSDSWDGVQPDSYFSATVVQWFDSDGNFNDDSIVVGRIHW